MSERNQWIQGLRELASFFEANPDIPIYIQPIYVQKYADSVIERKENFKSLWEVSGRPYLYADDNGVWGIKEFAGKLKLICSIVGLTESDVDEVMQELQPE